ncbi:MAG TPA: glycosyltransferase family A protein [Pyrinomonadaceae bacterium]|nr:glycosyltransferase family A protein [Pyrinomonadaceae bacterium]
MPSVSVIITSHDRPALLARAVASAHAAGRDVEVVVVDDASEDKTAEVCRDLESIKYVRIERNQNVAGARNVGILNSTAEFITFLDDDDLRLPDTLDRQASMLQSKPDAGFVFGQALIDDGSGNPPTDYYPRHCPQGDVLAQLLTQNFIPCGSVVFRRSCLFRVGLLDASIPGIDDWDLWIRIASLYPVQAVAQPVMIWRKSSPTSGQGTSHADRMVVLSTRQFQNKWSKIARVRVESDEARQQISRQFSRNMGCHLLVEASRSLSYGRLGEALSNSLIAVRLHPRGTVQTIIGAATRSRQKRAAATITNVSVRETK